MCGSNCDSNNVSTFCNLPPPKLLGGGGADASSGVGLYREIDVCYVEWKASPRLTWFEKPIFPILYYVVSLVSVADEPHPFIP